MITRHYVCNNCQYQFTLQESIHDPPRQQCPKCHKYKLFQDLTGQIHLVKQEPTTIGQQIDRNKKEMGKFGIEDTNKKHKEEYNKRKVEYLQKTDSNITSLPENKPWYNKQGANLSKELQGIDSNEKATKYILEGK